MLARVRPHACEVLLKGASARQGSPAVWRASQLLVRPASTWRPAPRGAGGAGAVRGLTGAWGRHEGRAGDSIFLRGLATTGGDGKGSDEAEDASRDKGEEKAEEEDGGFWAGVKKIWAEEMEKQGEGEKGGKDAEADADAAKSTPGESGSSSEADSAKASNGDDDLKDEDAEGDEADKKKRGGFSFSSIKDMWNEVNEDVEKERLATLSDEQRAEELRKKEEAEQARQAKAAQRKRDYEEAKRRATEAAGKASEAASKAKEATSGAGEKAKEAMDEKAGAAASKLGVKGKGSGLRRNLQIVFGIRPKEDVSTSKAAAYPWVEVRDPDTGSSTYVNEQTGEEVDDKPEGFDTWGRAAVADRETTALAFVEHEKGVWERITSQLSGTPAMRAVLEVGEAVKESPIGDAAKKVSDKVSDVKGDMQDTWETSQNPLIYNMSYAYDSMFGQTEMGVAIGKIMEQDPTFTLDGFALDMRDELVPDVVRAFLRGDRDALAARCSEKAMAPIGAALRAREVEGLTVDSNILSVADLDVKAAYAPDRHPPSVVFQVMVQQINCTRNKKGEIVEGRDDEIRAVYYAFSVQHVYNPETSRLDWVVNELVVQGAVLYI